MKKKGHPRVDNEEKGIKIHVLININIIMILKQITENRHYKTKSFDTKIGKCSM